MINNEEVIELLAECHEQYAEHLRNPTNTTKENLKDSFKKLKEMRDLYRIISLEITDFIKYVEQHKDFRKF